MSKLVGGDNAILLLVTMMAIGGATIVAFLAYRRNNPPVMRTFAGGAVILALLYGGGVIAASAASSEQVIEQGQTKWFCGFYLDCHLGMSVEGSENVAALPQYAKVNEGFRADLDRWMKVTADPRAVNENDDRWDRYPYYGAVRKPEPAK